MKKYYFLLFFIFLLFCCNYHQDNAKNSQFSPIGNWTFISYPELEYSEVYFDTTIVRFFSENDNYVGPFSYKIIRDSIFWLDYGYKVIFTDSNFITFNSDEKKFLLYRIPFDISNINANQVNPVYLRRCFYLLHLNKINFLESVTYLQDVTKKMDTANFPEEIIINNFPKK